MRSWKDDHAEATIISQLMIIGITAGIVFVAATYAYIAVDTAITEADQSGAQLALRGQLHRMESLVQQGVGASTVLDMPHQGTLAFAGFSPSGASQDRIAIMGTTTGITFAGLADGDNVFDVCGADGMQVTVTWTWNANPSAEAVETPAADCGGTVVTHALDGITTIEVRDAGELKAVAIVADLHLLRVAVGSDDDDATSWTGNIVVNGPDHVSAQTHVQAGDGLSLRLWALNGPSFATSGAEGGLRVRVTDQQWLAQALPVDTVSVQVAGPRAEGILNLYQDHGATITDDTAAFSVMRLDVHGTALEGVPET